MSVRECFEVLPRASRLLDIALLPRVLYHDAGVTDGVARARKSRCRQPRTWHACTWRYTFANPFPSALTSRADRLRSALIADGGEKE